MSDLNSISRINVRNHAQIALVYFLIAGLLGLILRLMPISDIALNYKFMVHAHSHIALLGWLYLAITTLLYELYLKDRNLSKRYKRIFWFTQVTLLGMLFTFPFTGYALFSIIFSTLFLFASYWFTGFFIRNVEGERKTSFAYRCFKWSLIYLVLSSLGPWALGGIMNTLGSTSPWYRFAIYFYLHFLYNGWAVLAIAGLVFHLLEQQGIVLDGHRFKVFFGWLNASILLTFFISIIWMEPSFTFYCLAVAGIIAQWVAFKIFMKWVSAGILILKDRLSSLTLLMLVLTGILFGGKLILQTLIAIPVLTDLSFKLNDLVIGFLHWVFLGFLTVGLFSFLHHFRLVRIGKLALGLYMTGFVLMEFLLFYRAAAIWQQNAVFNNYLVVLAIASAFIPTSVLWIIAGNLNGKRLD
ncbi:MAG: hypothetical protein GY751_10885 [Bacteroidetes bacterium]|nr:hypothetical protein [Bacteroidota bacterium]